MFFSTKRPLLSDTYAASKTLDLAMNKNFYFFLRGQFLSYSSLSLCRSCPAFTHPLSHSQLIWCLSGVVTNSLAKS